MTFAFRLCSSRFSVSDGEGASLFGGRWNPVGVPVVYAAESAALAALEILVHFSVLPLDYVLTEIRIPDSVAISQMAEDLLPLGWDADIPSAETQELGRAWVSEGHAAVLSVPSSLVPTNRNLLLNPGHADFGRIEFGTPAPFRFDPRLKR